MSFECPHLQDGICQLNHMECTPGKGQCVLRGKVVMAPKYKIKDDEREDEKKDDRKDK